MPTLDDSQNTPVNSETTVDVPAESPETTLAPGTQAASPPEYSLGHEVSAHEAESWDADAHAEQEAIGAVSSNGGSGASGGGNLRTIEDEPAEEGKMSFLDHLEELRGRIIRSVIAVVVGFFISWSYRDEIYAALSWPITSAMRDLGLPDKLVYTNPTGVFSLYVQMAFVSGLILAMPYLLYQVWGFIAPGLYPRERRYAVPFIFMCSFLFLSGAAFAYLVAFPATLHFLLDFSKQFQAMITVNEYFSLAIMIILGLAVVFELPVLILFLTLLRIVTPRFLLSNFRYALLLIFLVSAVITPTPDVPTMMLFAAPLTGLYFLGVLMSWIVVRLRKQREESS
jgi:sec-independent protein translocase protein TatC